MKRIISIMLLICLTALIGCAPEAQTPTATPGVTAADDVVTQQPDITPANTAIIPKPEAMFTLEGYPTQDGSTATIPLAIAVMSRLCGIEPDEAEIYVQHSKTNEAYRRLIDREVDVLLVYAPPLEAQDYAQEMNVQLTMEPIGRDALVFLTNDQNPVSSLTKQQIIDIYTGRITNWKDVGGPDLSIAAIQRDANSGSHTLMRNLVMGDNQMMNAPVTWMPGEMGDLIEVLKSYNNEQNALGYSVYYYVNSMYETTGLKLMPVGGVMPGNETIASGEYPFVNDFYAVIRSDEPAGSPAHKLYDFMLSAEGQALIAECGYVPAK